MKKIVLEYWRLIKLAYWCLTNVREADRYFREHTSFQRQLNITIDSCESLSLENAELKNTLYCWENGIKDKLTSSLELLESLPDISGSALAMPTIELKKTKKKTKKKAK